MGIEQQVHFDLLGGKIGASDHSDSSSAVNGVSKSSANIDLALQSPGFPSSSDQMAAGALSEP
jgi:hypothetical protein